MDDWVNLDPDEPFDRAEKQDETTAGTSESQSVAEPEKAEEEAPGPAHDEPVCRICFSGAEEVDLGRLISPCLCCGTVAKVHVECLNRWRHASRGRTSYFECDQCHYRYRVKRTRIAGLAESTYALAGLTAVFFSILVFVNGFIGNWLLKQSQSSDSVAGWLFFQSPQQDSYTYHHSWHYRDSYLPLDSIGYAVEFASKVADDISKPKQYTLEPAEKDADGSSYRMFRKAKRTKRQVAFTKARNAVSHFLLGISMTSIGSFVWMLVSLPFMPLRTGLFRTLRPNRDNRGNLTPLGTVVIVLFLLVGFIKSLHICWRLTKRTAKAILTRAEEGILEVH